MLKDNIVTHWKTSAFGIASAALLWWSGTGFKLPETKQEYVTTLGSMFLVVLGLGARDPKQPPVGPSA